MGDGVRLTRAELERLYQTFGPRLLAYLERRTGDPALATDLFQDVFLRLMESPIRAASAAEARSYLYRVAHSRLVDHTRRAQRERLWRARPWREQRIEASSHEDLEHAFLSLKPRDGTLLWLAYVEEMSHNEIAQVIGVKPASVKVMLHRARTKLRASMTHRGLAPEVSA